MKIVHWLTLSWIIDNNTSKSLCRIDVESMVFIPFPWNKYCLDIKMPFINRPWKCRVDKLVARKNNDLINYLWRFKKGMLYNQCSIESLVENYHKKALSFAILRRSFVKGSMGRSFLRKAFLLRHLLICEKCMSSLHLHVRWYLQALGIWSRPTSSLHIVREHTMFFITGIWIWSCA